MQPHHRTLIARILAHVDFLEESIADLQQEIEQCLVPFVEAVALLQRWHLSPPRGKGFSPVGGCRAALE